MSKTTIPTAGIADSAISTAKIADDAVTAAKAGFTAGKLLQVVTATFTDNQSTTSTSAAASVIACTITPSATSSKVMVFCDGGRTSFSGGTAEGKTWLYYQVGSGSFSEIVHWKLGDNNQSGAYAKTSLALNHLHSPNSTSALTYKIYFATNANTYFLNSDLSRVTMTLMEIGA